MKESDCLPCPCCGGHARIVHGKQYEMMLQDWHSKEDARYQPCEVQCVDCGLRAYASACNADHGGASGAFKEATIKAVYKWNKRFEAVKE